MKAGVNGSNRLARIAVLACCVLVLPNIARSELVLTGLKPMIVAGDPSGSPPDSPAARVDPNTTTSRYAGVGSFGGGTGTPFTRIHVLTAAHVLDTNNDGVADVNPASLIFHVNYGGNLTINIAASAVAVHPSWQGFNVGNNGIVNDDIGVVTLSSPLPVGVPIYSLLTTPVASGTTFIHVGYGQSGSGTSGYAGSANIAVKRVGMNNADDFILDDNGSGEREGYVFDFDGPTPATNYLGGLTLGNALETTFGGGDSGGPAFVDEGGVLKIAGNNTFVGSFDVPPGPSAPFFGSAGGGMLVHPYLDFLNQFQLAAVPEVSGFLLLSLTGAAAAIACGARRIFSRSSKSQVRF
jgi:hypothetical protein